MRSQLSLLVLLPFALAALAAVRRSSPAAPQPAFHRARRAVSDYPNPLIAKRQVKADSLRAPPKAKRACPSGLPSCECNPACSANQVCQFGTCVSTCDTSTGAYEDCSGICLNIQSDDSNNCGACGFTCPANRPVCDGGACACDAANGYVQCTSGCTTKMSDPINCGGCNQYCIGTGQVCQGGSCICDASNGYELCDETCTPISDYQDDFYNCGACGTVCPTGSTCQTGTCTCNGGLTMCEGTCVDTTSNSEYCGTCSTICYNDHVCVNSACVCPSGYADCFGNCIYVEDNENCGKCGNVCQQGSTCISGVCVCQAPTPALCSNGICAAAGSCPSEGVIAAYSGTQFMGYYAYDGGSGGLATSPATALTVTVYIGDGPAANIETAEGTYLGLITPTADWAANPEDGYGFLVAYETAATISYSGPYTDPNGNYYETAIWAVSSSYTSLGYAVIATWVDSGDGDNLPLQFFYQAPTAHAQSTVWAVNNPVVLSTEEPPFAGVTLWFQYATS